MDIKRSHYQALSVTDDQEKLLPTTRTSIHIRKSFTDDCPTDTTPTTITKKNKSFASRIKPYIWFLNTALLLVIAGLLLLLLSREQQQKENRSGSSSSLWQVGGDYAGKEPEFSTRVVKWQADMSFVPKNTTEFFSDETLGRWKTLMPAGTGFDTLSQASNKESSTSITFSTTSMTHQLHCLFMMGRIYAGVSTGVTDSLPEDYHEHFLHCIDYLRQGVMCAGDVAIEPHGADDADDLGPLDGGWNGLHVCKDYSQVLGYLEGQIADGSRTILPVDD